MVAYWLWVIYPIGKCAVILKSTTCYSGILAAAVKGVSLFIPCTILCGILLRVTVLA